MSEVTPELNVPDRWPAEDSTVLSLSAIGVAVVSAVATWLTAAHTGGFVIFLEVIALVVVVIAAFTPKQTSASVIWAVVCLCGAAVPPMFVTDHFALGSLVGVVGAFVVGELLVLRRDVRLHTGWVGPRMELSGTIAVGVVSALTMAIVVAFGFVPGGRLFGIGAAVALGLAAASTIQWTNALPERESVRAPAPPLAPPAAKGPAHKYLDSGSRQPAPPPPPPRP